MQEHFLGGWAFSFGPTRAEQTLPRAFPGSKPSSRRTNSLVLHPPSQAKQPTKPEFRIPEMEEVWPLGNWLAFRDWQPILRHLHEQIASFEGFSISQACETINDPCTNCWLTSSCEPVSITPCNRTLQTELVRVAPKLTLGNPYLFAFSFILGTKCQPL